LTDCSEETWLSIWYYSYSSWDY